VVGASGAAAPSARLDRLAHRLHDDPERIYNWVRGNVTFEPGWGSVLGAEGCRQTLTCDAHDTSSLLLALLEAAGYDARYVTGVVDVDARLFKSVVGDMHTLAAASKAADSSGWPHRVRPDGRHVRIAHVWVEVDLADGPRRWGARVSHRKETKPWADCRHSIGHHHPFSRCRRHVYVPLDAALKPHRFSPPKPLPFDTRAFARDLAATFTYDPGAAAITGFDGAAFDARLAAATNATFAGLERRRPGTPGWTRKLRDLLGTLKPDVRRLPVGRAAGSVRTAPAGAIVKISGRDEVLPDSVRHRVEVGFPGAGAGPVTSLYLDRLPGARLTVDFGAADQAAVDAVAAAGGPWAVAPRSILMRPVLLLDGEAVLTGAPIPFTDFQEVDARVIRPDGVVDSEATNFLRAGGVGALVIDPVRVGAGTLDVVGDRVDALARRLKAGPATLTFDRFHGEWLLAHGLAYFSLVDMATELAAHRLDVREVAAVPGIAMVSWQPVPGAETGSLQIDAQQLGIAGAVARDGDLARAALHRQAAGGFSSGMEAGVFGSMLGLNATSTMDILRRSLDAGRPIGVIVDDSSLATVLSHLVAPANVRDFIANSVANGFDNYVPLSPTTIGDWTGTGWMQLRPDDGAFGFLLSGGLSGGAVTNSDGKATQAVYDASVDGGLRALGQSSNFRVSTGANVASTVLAPIGAGIETYTTIKEIQAAGGSTGQAVVTGIATGLVRGAYGIATDVAATEAAVAGGPAAAFAVAAAGSQAADQATRAIKDYSLCGQVPCP
jgi:transglutaminase superfamily protein